MTSTEAVDRKTFR